MRMSSMRKEELTGFVVLSLTVPHVFHPGIKQLVPNQMITKAAQLRV